jgi:hypothetical protein
MILRKQKPSIKKKIHTPAIYSKMGRMTATFQYCLVSLHLVMALAYNAGTKKIAQYCADVQN